MKFQVTVRHGAPAMRYHTQTLEAADLAGILDALPAALPPQVVASGDLVEIRTAVDPESERPYSEPPDAEQRD